MDDAGKSQTLSSYQDEHLAEERSLPQRKTTGRGSWEGFLPPSLRPKFDP
ncbi:mCG147682 [Mus musculus]|nr:mCG147682 [Mus musculus]